VASTSIRRIRLVTGMVLFAYVTSHLLNLSLGLFALQTMERWLPIFLAPWQNPLGLIALYGSSAVHMALGFHALYARRTLRMGGAEAAQLILALALPPLLVLHVLGTRVVSTLVEFELSYAWLMWLYWEQIPMAGLRQVLVVVVAWIHGCMGIYYWTRLQPWWNKARGFVYPLVLVVPVLALLGFVEGGKEALILVKDPDWIDALLARASNVDDETIALIYRWENRFLVAYFTALALVLGLRAWRLRGGGGRREIQVSYTGGPTVRTSMGRSLLEISRANEIPHASVCGGKGRCGTCRVRIVEGGESLPPRGDIEKAMLLRIEAPEDVRLACQLVPTQDLAVERLLSELVDLKAVARPNRALPAEDLEVPGIAANLQAELVER